MPNAIRIGETEWNAVSIRNKLCLTSRRVMWHTEEVIQSLYLKTMHAHKLYKLSKSCWSELGWTLLQVIICCPKSLLLPIKESYPLNFFQPQMPTIFLYISTQRCFRVLNYNCQESAKTIYIDNTTQHHFYICKSEQKQNIETYKRSMCLCNITFANPICCKLSAKFFSTSYQETNSNRHSQS